MPATTASNPVYVAVQARRAARNAERLADELLSMDRKDPRYTGLFRRCILMHARAARLGDESRRLAAE